MRGKVKQSLIALGVAATAVGACLALATMSARAEAANSDKIAALLNDLHHYSGAQLQSLPALTITPWEVPGPGVDVMRAQLEETYTIDGLGTDTVDLSGWIAVRHDNARAADPRAPMSWNNAVVDTEFVDLDLHGVSKLFGPIDISLDRSRPSRGQVGRIEIPELARVTLMARLEKNEAQGGGAAAGGAGTPTFAPLAGTRVTKGKVESVKPIGTVKPSPADARILQPVACGAPVVVRIGLKDLGLDLKTGEQVVWYSLVDTIPPVGHTASVTIKPVALVADDGRAVGSLQSGVVKFREVVRQVPLASEQRLAQLH